MTILFLITFIFLIFQTIFFFKKIFQLKKDVLQAEHILNENVLLVNTDLQGTIIKVSSAFLKLMDYEENELIGKTHKIFKHSEKDSKNIEILWNALHKNLTWTGKLKNKTKDGLFIWFQVEISPIFKFSEKIGYAAIYKDITTEIKFSELNRKLEDNIKEREKLINTKLRLSQLGEMIAMIGHQWRQPLASIGSTLNTLKIKLYKDDIDKDFFFEKINQIEVFSNSLSTTINDFKDFYKIEKNLSYVNIKTIIENIFTIIEPSIKTEIKISSEDIFLSTYKNELQQVILSILKNADEAISERNIKNGLISINIRKNKATVIIDIQDNGGGIEPSIIESIFDPYFTTKENLNGSGLGLYMSKIIVEEHLGGILTAKNRNNGANFNIILKK